MKILIPPLREGFPKSVHEEYDAKELELEFVDLSYLKNVVLDGLIEKFQDTVNFRGHLRSRVEHMCARCLKKVEENIDHPFEVNYEIKGQSEIDTLDDLREILILEHPIRFLCKEDCAGLCPNCGADLNSGRCVCSN
jgi:uncharacterized protein